MTELKTKVSAKSVDRFLKSVASGKRLNDCFTVLELMKKNTQDEPKMWAHQL